MQISPRYEGPPVLVVDGGIADPSVPLLRQRRRLAEVLRGLDAEQWASPSRCERWSVQDVVAHLVGTNQFWTMSFSAGRAGEPTRVLAAFDPVVTPALMVDAVRGEEPAAVLDRFVETTEAMAGSLAGADEDTWATLAEAPPGHIPLHGVVLHALWDSWIHERDVLLPLGLQPAEEADEIVASLRYVAGIGPSFCATVGSARQGSLVVEAHDPDTTFVVDAGSTVVVHDGPAPDHAPRLTGAAVDLVEALSFRLPLRHDLDPGDQWLLGSLGEVFDITA